MKGKATEAKEFDMRHFAIRGLSSLRFLLCAWIAASQGPRATFAVAHTQPLLDDWLSISVSGLPPNRLITTKARSKAQDQLWWRSEAVFNTGVQGTIDLRTQAPVSGSSRELLNRAETHSAMTYERVFGCHIR
jgi:hypothetical protein